jgi:hypothetical protein
MDLEQIRRRVAHDPNAKSTQKSAARQWLISLSADYPIALTLTLKQTVIDRTATGAYQRALTRMDCDRIAKRFMQKLNREVFGKCGADKYAKSLKYLPVIEGQRSGKALHLHFAIGGLPSHIRLNEIDALVIKAKQLVKEIHTQHKVDAADSGWMEYICKELGSKDTDNVLWHLA